MKKLIFALAGIVILLVIAVLVGLSVMDLRPRLVAAVHDATGRQLHIDGDLYVALFPTLRLSASGVRLSNAQGAATPEMVSVGSLALEASWWPLLRGRLAIGSLELRRPVVHLEVDSAGRANWALRPAGETLAGAVHEPTSGGMEIGAIKIEDGSISYHDGQTGRTVEAKDIALTSAIATPEGPLSMQGRMTLNAETVTLNVAVDSPAALRASRPAKLQFALETRQMTMKFDGETRQSPAPGLSGVFDLDIRSVGALAAWLQQPLDKAQPDPGPLKIHAAITSDGPRSVLKDTAITGKAIQATAQGSFDGGQKPPAFDVKIDVKQADLNAYLPPPEKPAATVAAPAEPAQAAGWSAVPFDLSLLGAANGKAEITLAALRYRDLDVTNATVGFTLADRVLKLTTARFTLARGTIDSTGTLDAASGAAKIGVRATIAGLQVRPLLRTFAGTDRFGGTAALEATVAGTGRSPKELVSSLDGAGSFKVTNGAIYGINLAQTLRKAGTLGLGNAQAEETDFAELSGTYTIKAGVIENRDMKMSAPLFRLAGSGSVPMPPQTMDYAIEARLVPSIEGQGGRDALAGLPIPIKVTGPWSDPRYQVDWTGVFREMATDPERLKNLPGDLGKAAKDLGLSLPIPGTVGGGTIAPDQIIKAIPGIVQPPAPADGQKKSLLPSLDLPKSLFPK